MLAAALQTNITSASYKSAQVSSRQVQNILTMALVENKDDLEDIATLLNDELGSDAPDVQERPALITPRRLVLVLGALMLAAVAVVMIQKSSIFVSSQQHLDLEKATEIEEMEPSKTGPYTYSCAGQPEGTMCLKGGKKFVYCSIQGPVIGPKTCATQKSGLTGSPLGPESECSMTGSGLEMAKCSETYCIGKPDGKYCVVKKHIVQCEGGRVAYQENCGSTTQTQYIGGHMSQVTTDFACQAGQEEGGCFASGGSSCSQNATGVPYYSNWLCLDWVQAQSLQQ